MVALIVLIGMDTTPLVEVKETVVALSKKEVIILPQGDIGNNYVLHALRFSTIRE